MGFEFEQDFLEPIGGDVLIVDDEEGVGALDARACDGGRGADALEQAAKFIEVGLIPCALELGMEAKLAILKCLTSVEVQDRHIPVVEERIGLLKTVSCGWSNNIGLWELGKSAGSHMHRLWMAAS